MPKWVYFLIGVGAAIITFQRIGSIHYDSASAYLTGQLATVEHGNPQLVVPWAILYGLKYSGQAVADGLVALAFGIISSMGFYLSVKR